MLGYLAGPAIGARTGTVVYTYTLPFLLVGLGWWLATEITTPIAHVRAAHIGNDRTIGYGLKYATDFKDTHLDRRQASFATP